MTLPSMAISWISTTPATGEEADKSLPPLADCNCMKAPLAFCCATVARAQGSLTVVWAWAVKARQIVAAAKAI